MIPQIVRYGARSLILLVCIPLLSEPVAAQRRPDVRFEASVATEAASPEDWSTGMHRGSLFGGGWLGAFHLVGGVSAWGSEFGRMAPGSTLFVPVGVDTTFMLPLEGGGPGSDSLAVAFPRFVEWDEGAAFPFDRADSADLALRAAYALPRGDVALSYGWARAQRMSRTLEQLYNPDAWIGRTASDRTLRLDGRLDVVDFAGGAVALELDVRHTRGIDRSGIPDQESMTGQQDGILGFETASLGFLADEDVDYDDETLLAYRFDALPFDHLQLRPGQQELATKQTYMGIAENLRINPYGLRTGFPLSGWDNRYAFAQDEETETRFAAALDWTSPAGAWARVGADHAGAEVDVTRLTLYSGRGYLRRNEPTRTGAFARAAFSRPQVAVSAGVRYDRVDPDGVYSRVPGFVSFLPDSLRRDFMVDDPATPGLDLVPYEDVVGSPCFGAVPCLDNFREARVQSGVGFDAGLTIFLPLESRATATVSDRMLAPLAPAGVTGSQIPAREWIGLLFANADLDFSSGLASTGTAFGRDVDLPRERLLQLRYAIELERLFLDAAIYSREIRDGYTFRSVEYDNPVTGSSVFINSLVNTDPDPERGFDVHAAYRLGALSEVSVGYSHVDGDVTLPLHTGAFSFVDAAAGAVFDRGAWTDRGFGPASAATLDAGREHLVRFGASLLTARDRPGILADAALHAQLRFASGLEYRRLVNEGNGQIGPPAPGGPGILAEAGTRDTHWVSWLTLRAHKGIPLAGARLRAFIEWSGPLRENQSQVFLETGSARNDLHRELVLTSAMADQNLDGDAGIDDFWVRDCMDAAPALCEVPGNDLNAYALQEAEDRFGDGDGLFTVEEQRSAFDAWYQLFAGEQVLRRSDRSLRLGLELRF